MRAMARMQNAATMAVIVTIFGCAGDSTNEATTGDETSGETGRTETDATTRTAGALEARATLTRSDGTTVGDVVFQEDEGHVEVHARVHDIDPGEHGLHVHETGDCSAEDLSSAGGHFNPTGAAHGAPGDAEHHAGDFGNITVGADGNGELELDTDMLTISEGRHGVIGKAMILHAQADDLSTQPSGAAGARIACGVIESIAGGEETAGLPDEGADEALHY